MKPAFGTAISVASLESGQAGVAVKVKRFPLLAETKVLVVEENFLQAEDMARAIQSQGGSVIGPASSVELALRLIEQDRPDAALLAPIVSSLPTVPVANRLIELKVPYVVVTGFPRELLPVPLRAAPYVAKPYYSEELIEALAAVLGAAGSTLNDFGLPGAESRNSRDSR